MTAGLAIPRRRRLRCLTLLALGACIATGAPAVTWANAPVHPEYSIAITEGASTSPELFPVAMTDGHVSPAATAVLSIIHNGTVVAMRTDPNGDIYLDQVPQVGDVVTLASPSGVIVGSVVYDGLPSMDPTVCAGSRSFSGQRSPGQEVEGGFYSLALHTDPYGHTSARETGSGRAQVTTLAGSSYAGNFLAPLAIGQTVWASESLRTPLAGGAVFGYSSENVRPVGPCPPPPPVAAPPPPPPALQGSILKLPRIVIRRLLRRGWLDQVTINQPGTVFQDLYLAGSGHLPAFASSRRGGRHHRKPKPLGLLLARGSASAASAGTVSVLLHVTPQGRRKLGHARRVRAILITTLRSTAGAELNLERRTLTLHR
jgi:hypothetical protein